MSETFRTLITRQGAALIAAAATEGADFRLATLVAGSRDAPPDEAATVVPDEVWRGPITGVTAGADEGVAVIDAALPLEAGGFTVRQIGVLDADGALILHASVPEAYKPTRAAGATKDMAFRMVIRFANAQAVNLLIDPHIVTATRKWTESFVAEVIEAAIAVHDADPAAHSSLVDQNASTALADLALRHALEQDAASIIGPAYEGRDFPAPDGASAASGWRHSLSAAHWHGGLDEFADAGAADWDAAAWTGDIARGRVDGGAGETQRLALADPSGDWDLGWEFDAWDPPEPGAAARASGRVEITLPSRVVSTYTHPVVKYGSDPGIPSGRFTHTAVTTYRLRLRAPSGVALQDIEVNDSAGTTVTVNASATATGPAGNLPAGVRFTVGVLSRQSTDRGASFPGSRRQYGRHYRWTWRRVATSGGEGEVSAAAAGAFTGGADAAAASTLSLAWDGFARASAVVFQGTPDRGIQIRSAPGGNPTRLARAYLGRRFRLRRRGESLELHDIGAAGEEDDARPARIGQWTVPDLTALAAAIPRYADTLRWSDVSLFRPASGLRAEAGDLIVSLAAPDAAPARLAWAARANPAEEQTEDWSNLTAAVSRDGGTTWIDSALRHVRDDEAGLAILAGAAVWPADSPPGRDLRLRFRKAAGHAYAVSAIGVYTGG